MSRVSGKNTKPELIMRTLLHRAGYRFKINDKDLPGKPDIVLPKYGTTIFIHGCFWHQHKNCKQASVPQTNQEFWQQKFIRNQRKDSRTKRQLNAMGWSVMTLWECKIKKDPQAALNRIIKKLANTINYEYKTNDTRQNILKAAEKKWRYLKDEK